MTVPLLNELPETLLDQAQHLAVYRGITLDAYLVDAIRAYNRDTQREKDLIDSLSDLPEGPDSIPNG